MRPACARGGVRVKIGEIGPQPTVFQGLNQKTSQLVFSNGFRVKIWEIGPQSTVFQGLNQKTSQLVFSNGFRVKIGEIGPQPTVFQGLSQKTSQLVFSNGFRVKIGEIGPQPTVFQGLSQKTSQLVFSNGFRVKIWEIGSQPTVFQGLNQKTSQLVFSNGPTLRHAKKQTKITISFVFNNFRLYLTSSKHALMSIPKRMRFSKKRQYLALLHQALSHPARLSICELLAEEGPSPFAILVEAIPLAPSTISHHLRRLEKSQLIAATEWAGETLYSIQPNTWQNAQISIQYFFQQPSRWREHTGPFSINSLPLTSYSRKEVV